MKIKVLIWVLISLLFRSFQSTAQELFVHSEPASAMPKGLLSLRYSLESYQYESIRRHWHALRVLYGVTGNFYVIGSYTMSNHHPQKYPSNPYAYFANHHRRGYNPDYRLKSDGFHLFGLYRIYSKDEPNGHIRIAITGEGSYINTAHDEAEPHLLGDNSGYGGSIIVTKLIKKLALNLKAGFINPLDYNQPQDQIRFRSGNARYAIFSTGYLLFPKIYESYDDVNINVYLEMVYKEYDEAKLYIRGNHENTKIFPYLREGKYLEVKPGLQLILNSRDRIDVSAGFTAWGNTFLRLNPTVYFNFQKYLFK
jgi:hypothetical protein